jgi:hypothetical protein
MDNCDKIKITQKDPTTGAWFEISSDDKNDRFCKILNIFPSSNSTNYDNIIMSVFSQFNLCPLRK